MKSFKEAIVWQKSYKLTLFIYRITAQFPRAEEFGLKSQLRRAAVSLISNFAEGFKRISYKERIQYYKMSEGSLEEIKCQTELCKDLGYLSLKIYGQLEVLEEEVGRLLWRWISVQK
ncbi:four helix bundle protein [Candidatus Peregrinibacteria bacterium]|nr:four helix bundle protein [Candidatus Peregrinibacteria bacterium]